MEDCGVGEEVRQVKEKTEVAHSQSLHRFFPPSGLTFFVMRCVAFEKLRGRELNPGDPRDRRIY